MLSLASCSLVELLLLTHVKIEDINGNLDRVSIIVPIIVSSCQTNQPSFIDNLDKQITSYKSELK